MTVDVVVEGEDLDVGYLARRALCATRSLAYRHAGAAVRCQVVRRGLAMPAGSGQSLTEAVEMRAPLSEAFLSACAERGVDDRSPSPRVRDVICYVGPGVRGRIDAIGALSELQATVRRWARERGACVAIGLHALETLGDGRSMRLAHLHLVGLDVGGELEALVGEWVAGRGDLAMVTGTDMLRAALSQNDADSLI